MVERRDDTAEVLGGLKSRSVKQLADQRKIVASRAQQAAAAAAAAAVWQVQESPLEKEGVMVTTGTGGSWRRGHKQARKWPVLIQQRWRRRPRRWWVRRRLALKRAVVTTSIFWDRW